MIPLVYYLASAVAFFLVRHPLGGMLVPVPLIYFYQENPLMIWVSILGTATAFQALRSIKPRVWPQRLYVPLLAVPIVLLVTLPEYTLLSVLSIILVHPLVFSWEMMYRFTPYVVGTALLCTTILQDNLRMQLNVMAVQAFFTIVMSFFFDAEKVKEKTKKN